MFLIVMHDVQKGARGGGIARQKICDLELAVEPEPEQRMSAPETAEKEPDGKTAATKGTSSEVAEASSSPASGDESSAPLLVTTTAEEGTAEEGATARPSAALPKAAYSPSRKRRAPCGDDDDNETGERRERSASGGGTPCSTPHKTSYKKLSMPSPILI